MKCQCLKVENWKWKISHWLFTWLLLLPIQWKEIDHRFNTCSNYSWFTPQIGQQEKHNEADFTTRAFKCLVILTCIQHCWVCSRAQRSDRSRWPWAPPCCSWPRTGSSYTATRSPCEQHTANKNVFITSIMEVMTKMRNGTTWQCITYIFLMGMACIFHSYIGVAYTRLDNNVHFTN